MEYPSHIKIEADGNKVIQTVREHAEESACYAKRCLEPANLCKTGYLAGLIHDAGKMHVAFAEYIEKAANGEKVLKGSVVHTFQGCRLLLERYHKSNEDLDAELIAYAAAAHHGQFDCVGRSSTDGGKSRIHGFDYRTGKQGIGYEEAKAGFLELCQGGSRLDSLFEEAKTELGSLFEKISDLADGNSQIQGDDPEEGGDDKKFEEEASFYSGLTARLILSAVIEGDRRDTARFMNGTVYPSFPGFDDKTKFWGRLLDEVEKKLMRFERTTPIQKARGEISDQCRRFASNGTGIYRLNVPTGAGKTLSSLRFALAHAALYKKRRIIFTAPLLSIIDQNAQVIREYLGDDSIILEHHTEIGDVLDDKKIAGNKEGKNKDNDHRKEELTDRELLAENWDAPVIITSMVQLLLTLFGGKNANIRRFQALCGSVVVIDEVQSVPAKMITLFNLAVNYLSGVCDVTFLLCSATQPYLEGVDHPLFPEPKDVVPYDEKLWAPFKRTSILEAAGMKLEEIPSFVANQLEKTTSLLVICNKKAEAEYLFDNVKDRQKNCICFHLSASMCMKHRKDKLKKMTDALEMSRKGDPKVICISTQVIEAGVDISFGRVIRFEAGLDSIVQAAGRCNRNGEDAGQAPVYIVDCIDEKLGKLTEIQAGKTALKGLLESYRNNPEDFRKDLTSSESVRCYYRKLYEGMEENYQDFAVEGRGRSVFSMLSQNRGYQSCARKGWDRYFLNQAFAEAGAAFHVFEEDSDDVVVPYKGGEALIAEFEKMKAGSGSRPLPFNELKDWLKKVKPYTVSVYGYQKEALEKAAGIYEIDGVLFLRKELYDQETGLCSGGGNNGFLEI